MTILVNPYLYGTRNVSICQGNSYTFNGITYTASVTGVSDSIPNSNTCDSIITLNLTVLQNTYGIQTDSICQGSTYIFNGTAYTSSNNTAKDTLVNAQGCDSIVTLHLTVIPVNPVTAARTFVACGSYVYKGITYTQNSALLDTLYTTFGCDSVYRTTNIIIHPEYHLKDTVQLHGCDFLVYKGVRYEQDAALEELIKTIHGCDSINRLVVIQVTHFKLQATLMPELPYEGLQATVNTSSDSGPYQTVSWTPANLFPDQSLSTQQVNATDGTIITVVAKGEEGCNDTAIIKVKTRPYRKDVIVPNAFTPNGDGRNDVFIPVLALEDNAYKLTDFRVFNRWGQLLFSTAHINIGWDGTFKGQPQDQDVYYYTLTVIFLDGSTKTFKGDVTLLR